LAGDGVILQVLVADGLSSGGIVLDLLVDGLSGDRIVLYLLLCVHAIDVQCILGLRGWGATSEERRVGRSTKGLA
jgi:hypothetical protein